MSKEKTNPLFEKLNEFIKKYYQNQLIKGGIYVISTMIIFFLFFAIIEYFSSFGVIGRTFLFWSYIVLSLVISIKLLIIPLLNLFKIGETINYKQASRIIGDHFPEINDKLLNILELSEISDGDNALITASINQKSKKISPISFKNAIDFSINKKYIKWILLPMIIIFIFIISGKDYILTESSARIIRHNTFFEPKAPFNYVILNKTLECKQFDNFLLRIRVEGNEIPNEIFIKFNKNTFKMKNLRNNEFTYKFSRIHSDVKFNFFGGGYLSKKYTVKSLLQPKIVDIKINISHPKYTNKKNETIINNGDITVSEGSVVNWEIQSENTDSFLFLVRDKIITTSNENNVHITQQIINNSNYSIITANRNNLSDTLSYFIKVIDDLFPKITLMQFYDTINTQYLFNGIIEDDYLVKKLEFIYTYESDDSLIIVKEEISIQQKNSEQFFHAINFQKLNIPPGKKLNYFFKVWDNDNINGPKSTKSTVFSYKEADINELIAKKDIENQKTKLGLNKSILLNKDIQKEIAELQKKILSKKDLTWEDKQKAKDLIKAQNKLQKQILDTQKKNSNNLKIQEKLNSAILEKQKKLDDLMSKISDEEIRKLLEKMTKIMDEENKQKLKDLLEKLNQESTNLEKELDRELELFKQLEFEEKLEETLQKITKLKQQQENLKNETNNLKAQKKDLPEKQKQIKDKMEELEKDLKSLRKKNMELEDRHHMPKTQKLEKEITDKMQESQKALEQGIKKKSKRSQQIAIEKLEELAQKMQSIQQASSEDKPIENIETLRKILENLITLSFNQEDLLTHVNNTPRNSPKFVKMIQEQNKLSNDSKIIEDSLFALSKRVIQIQATINKEIASIKSNMQKATNELENRNVNKATERQQFVMTATNNLALLLSEILEQMQKQLDMPPSNCNKPRNCNKQSPNCNKPSMSELKKAQKKLNKKTKKGEKGEKGEKGKNKKGEKHGEKCSKDLIMLAKEQAKLREQLIELRDEIGKNGEKGKIDKIIKDMEENERDIINNQITQETINRQKDILTRLLEAENSKREQGEDNKRISNEWEFESENQSQEFLKYQQQQKDQKELFKTTPVQLTPFYKKKVNTYFNNIIND